MVGEQNEAGGAVRQRGAGDHQRLAPHVVGGAEHPIRQQPERIFFNLLAGQTHRQVWVPASFTLSGAQ